MEVILQTTDYELPKDCGYNKLYRHNWVTPVYGLSMTLIPIIHDICKKRWGWHFRPHKDMNYHSNNWYEKQNMVLSFESKLDLILVKLMIDVK